MVKNFGCEVKNMWGECFLFFQIPLVQKRWKPLPKYSGGSFSPLYPWLGEHVTICSMSDERKDRMKGE